MTAVQAAVSPGWGDETAHEQKTGCSAAAGPVAASHQPVGAACSQAPAGLLQAILQNLFAQEQSICTRGSSWAIQRFAPSPAVMEVTPSLLCQLLSTQLQLTGVSLTSFPFIQVWFQRLH